MAVAPDHGVGVTPTFFGANPAHVPRGHAHAGFRLIGAEEDAAFTLSGSLEGGIRSQAVIANRSLGDIVSGPGRKLALRGFEGVPLARLNEAQRGGVMRILELLDSDAIKRDPKPIVGFSDLTAFSAWCVKSAGVRTIHGPMVNQIGRVPGEELAWLFALLEDPSPPGVLVDERPRVGARGGGTVEGRMVGGNLEMVTRLLGTPWAFDLGASVLVLEDVGERPYRIDRALTQLKLAGALDGVRAVCLGDFLRSDEEDGMPPTAAEVLAERLTAFDIPAVGGLPVGHGDHNLAFPLGGRCAVDLAVGRVVLEEGAVE